VRAVNVLRIPSRVARNALALATAGLVAGIAATTILVSGVLAGGSATPQSISLLATPSPVLESCSSPTSGVVTSADQAIAFAICFLRSRSFVVNGDGAIAVGMTEEQAVTELGISDGVDDQSQRQVWLLGISGYVTGHQCPHFTSDGCSNNSGLTAFRDDFYIYAQGGGVGGGVLCTGECYGRPFKYPDPQPASPATDTPAPRISSMLTVMNAPSNCRAIGT
jgi:hypothetical protein